VAYTDVAPWMCLNAYPLRFPPGATLDYQVWSVDPVPISSELREKIRSYLWRAAIRRPVQPMYVGDRFAYAVGGRGEQEPILYVGEGERRYVVEPTSDCRSIGLDRPQGDEAELAALMLQAQFVLHLRRDQRLTGGHASAQFFRTTPDTPFPGDGHRHSDRGSGAVDIFRGITFRVVHLQGAGLCLVLDVRTSYVGRDTLAEYLARGQQATAVETERGFSRWVNDYGRTKQGVYLVVVEGRGIGEVILNDGRTVYQYLKSEHPEVGGLISPTDRAVTMAYRIADVRNESKHYTGAATLLKPKYTTQSAQVRALRDTPAFPAEERQRRIVDLRHHFYGASFAGQPIKLGTAVRMSASTLPLPRLVFGQGDQRVTLHPNLPGQAESEARRSWGSRKLRTLEHQGPFRTAEFVNPVIVYPARLEDDGLLDTFIKQTAVACNRLGRTPFEPRLSPYQDSAHARELIAKLRGIAQYQHAGFLLFALPADAENAARAYAGLKTQVALPSKCFSTVELRRRAHDQRRLASYIERNALAMLVENGTRPWGIADPLTYDLQFGFDVARTKHGGVMGASVIGDVAGADIAFAYKEMDARERIPTKIIRLFVSDRLEQFFATHGRPPRRVLFLRDGRLLDAERKGIRTALRKFAEAHPGQPKPEWAMVSVEKTTSVPLRLLREVDRGVDGAFSGSYVTQNARAGYLVLAGKPSLPQGTPRPCRIEVVEFNSDEPPDLVSIFQDMFWLSQLNWSAPEIDMRLPIILRFTDQKLERYALELDDEDEEEDDDEDDDEAGA